MPLISAMFKTFYRLTCPGGALLLVAAILLRLGTPPNPDSSRIRFVAVALLLGSLILSAAFRRSLLFFATLVLTLSQAALAWGTPNLSTETARVLANCISILLPLNLMALAFMRERGIVSPGGRKRLIFLGAQVIAVALFCLPPLAPFASSLDQPIFAAPFSDWTHLSQWGLLAFIVAAGVMLTPLVRRYRSVESSLFWALVASFIAFLSGGSNFRAGIFFATGGMALIVAVLETSYKMAYHDELTQLPSRRALNETLMKLPESYTIAMVDVDHFKKFNDSYGHEAGDHALRLVASRLAFITGGGKAYRYGGEEFAVVFPGKPPEEVFVYLDRMRRLIEQSTFVVRGKDRRKGRGGRTRTVSVKRQTNVTVSIGVAASNGDRLTPAEVLRIADQALYRAKAKGRNCTVTIRGSKGAGDVGSGMRVVSVS